jgi:excisionase family DNA binding protein
MTAPVPPDCVCRKEIARRLGVTVRTVQRLEKTHGLPVSRIGKIRRYSIESFHAWVLANQRVAK